MGLTTTHIIYIAIYLIAVLLIGLWARRKETAEEYLIAARNVGVIQTTASTVAVLGGVALIAQAALAFELGYGAIWFWIGFGLGFVFLGLTVGRLKKVADENKMLTLSEYISNKLGVTNAIFSSVIFFVALFALLTGQFIAGGSLFAPLLGISYTNAILLIGIGTLLYLITGGFKAVIKTDLLQFLIMFIVIIILAFNIDLGVGSTTNAEASSLGIDMIIIFLLMGVFLVYSSADIMQRVFAARSVDVAKKASYYSAVLVVIFGTALTYIGVAAKNHFPDINPNEALYYGLVELLPPAFLGLIVLVILAAIMSTIDTELFYLSSSIARDFKKDNNRNQEGTVKIIRHSILIIALVSILIAIFVSDILLLTFALVSLALTVSPLIIASLFWNVKPKAAFLSMTGGVLAFIALLLTNSLSPDTAVITLPTALVFLIIGQVAFRKSISSNTN